ncbi:fatty acid hydroxylase domain-containing protein 2 isoform X3 [Tympanuchus pallidicinctus]|uniref:fatty acid hydroxylase domain-containing protein 2 isoform X3 n=1 Tax=Tympanuchus pallidicinctus TaxID=109042 RepID=UPI00228731B4|nr:fatty acid hydroxylase domain-containing protein 2 isoform X3 [Tympanuchus pallidicinctus]
MNSSFLKHGKKNTPKTLAIITKMKRDSGYSTMAAHQEQEEKLWAAVKMSALVLGSALLIFTALMNSVSWCVQKIWDTSGYFWQTTWLKLYYLFEGREWSLFLFGAALVPSLAFWCFNGILMVADVTGKPTFITRYRIQLGKNDPQGITHFPMVSCGAEHLYLNRGNPLLLFTQARSSPTPVQAHPQEAPRMDSPHWRGLHLCSPIRTHTLQHAACHDWPNAHGVSHGFNHSVVLPCSCNNEHFALRLPPALPTITRIPRLPSPQVQPVLWSPGSVGLSAWNR